MARQSGGSSVTDRQTSYDVRIYKLHKEARAAKRPYRIRWAVARLPRPPFSKYFATYNLAQGFLDDLSRASRKGEAFDIETGLPMSILREELDKKAADNTVTLLQHLRDYTEYKWPRVSGKGRKGMADVLRDIMLAVMPVNSERPQCAPGYKHLNEAFRLWLFRPDALDSAGDDVPVEILDAIGWAEKHTPNLNEIAVPVNTRRLLDALCRTHRGTQASANYFNRRRAVLYNVFAYAIAENRLDSNPLDAPDLKWERPNDLQSDDVVDPRSVGAPAQVAEMLVAVTYVGREQGPRFVAFFGCMYYGMMRPEEVINLRRNQCELPESGWGRLILSDAAAAVGRHWTDDGTTHEVRALKHRGRTTTRPVPIQPQLVQLLRQHIKAYRIGSDDRLFTTVRGNPIDSGVYGRVWKAAREFGLSETERATPRLRRPYDLRHSGVSLRRTAGVPSRQVAEWAGHSVEVLERVYSKILDGYDDRWQRQIDAFMDG